MGRNAVVVLVVVLWTYASPILGQKPTKQPTRQPSLDGDDDYYYDTNSPTIFSEQQPLDSLDLNAWFFLFDTLGGKQWKDCSNNRLTPCDCVSRITCKVTEPIFISIPSGNSSPKVTRNNDAAVNHITELRLSGNNLSGKIQKQNLFSDFVALRVLDLTNNPKLEFDPTSQVNCIQLDQCFSASDDVKCSVQKPITLCPPRSKNISNGELIAAILVPSLALIAAGVGLFVRHRYVKHHHVSKPKDEQPIINPEANLNSSSLGPSSSSSSSSSLSGNILLMKNIIKIKSALLCKRILSPWNYKRMNKKKETELIKQSSLMISSNMILSGDCNIGIDFGSHEVKRFSQLDGKSNQEVSRILNATLIRDSGLLCFGGVLLSELDLHPERCFWFSKVFLGSPSQDFKNPSESFGFVQDAHQSAEVSAVSLIRGVLGGSSSSLSSVPIVAISVPAHFSDVQRSTLAYCGKLAGIERVILVEDYIASGFAFFKRFPDVSLALVLDVGCFSSYAVVIEQSSFGFPDVKGFSCKPVCGSRMIDNAIFLYICSHQLHLSPENLTPQQTYKLFQACRTLRSKFNLSLDTIPIKLMNFFPDQPTKDVDIILHQNSSDFKKQVFEEICKLVTKMVQEALLSLKPSHVRLVGGTCRIPEIRKCIDQVVYKRIGKQCAISGPSEMDTAEGCSLYAAAIRSDVIREITPPNPISEETGLKIQSEYRKVTSNN